MLGAIPGARVNHDNPVFGAPWQAQAFALTLALHERGVFSWSEWTQALSAEIAAHAGHDDGDVFPPKRRCAPPPPEGASALGRPGGADYYEHWLAALERLAAAKGLVSEPELTQRMHAWQSAARRTPHGKPIEL
ncbi:MAG: nitrile hydratase accessory protein [Burkholderiales bacterium]|nr:nitrile hydratase accessory protein [Burkholderiales bacterium]